MKKLSIRISDEQYRALEALAQHQRCYKPDSPKYDATITGVARDMLSAALSERTKQLNRTKRSKEERL